MEILKLVPLVAQANDISFSFIELGIVIIGLGILARLAYRWGLPAIPLYLLAGLAFGRGGILPLNFTEGFVNLGAEIGVILLLFMLGLEYTGEELQKNLSAGFTNGAVDFILNFLPGLIAGLIMNWGPLASWLLGGVTYISFSGVVARILSEMHWLNNKETPAVISILVLEDLIMAVFLPLTTVLLLGQGLITGTISILIALVTVGVVLFIAIRYGKGISHGVYHKSDEITLLTVLGIILLVAGLAQQLQVSAAVGAFLVGIALSEPIAEQARRLLSPLRDLFAAIFFLFFGLEINPSTLPPVLLVAISLGIITIFTKVATGWWAGRHTNPETLSRLRAGVILVAHGEFSIVIAGLGISAGLDSRLGTLSAAYVLFLAILGPILARLIEPLYFRFQQEKSV